MNTSRVDSMQRFFDILINVIGGVRAAFVRVLRLFHPGTAREWGWGWTIGLIIIALLVVNLVFTLYWDRSPGVFDVRAVAREAAQQSGGEVVTGYTTTATLVKVADTLLEKPGGYLSNDVLPPALFMDNMPNWEFGVLVQVRDLARALRNDISRSQSQSVEDRDLAVAEPQFNFDSSSWMFPATEGEYREGITALRRFLRRLNDENQADAQFYARADNLVDWLSIVEKRLGSMSQRLSASVGQVRVNTDLAGDAAAQQATPGPAEVVVKTPWLEIDDVFYEARGATWALLHFLKAAEIDFRDVLQKKNALVSLRQIIRELESTQSPMWSPLVLNGRGFGLFPNHSLVMASYISRANAAIIDLVNLLQQG